MLGTELASKLSSHDLLLTGRSDLDISNENAVLNFCKQNKPDTVINSAAFTNVDACETEKDLAWMVNAWGCRNLALACSTVGSRLISISTDYVFEGDFSRPYHEFDVANGGKTVYGQTKFAGEQFIRQLCPNHLIVRVAWLYGNNGKNFVDTMLSLAEKNLSEIKVVNDQIGNPTSTSAVTYLIKDLLRTDYKGVVHGTCEGSATWYDFAKTIFELSGLHQKVVPCTSKEFVRPAPRPSNSRLEKRVIQMLGLAPCLNGKKNWPSTSKHLFEISGILLQNLWNVCRDSFIL